MVDKTVPWLALWLNLVVGCGSGPDARPADGAVGAAASVDSRPTDTAPTDGVPLVDRSSAALCPRGQGWTADQQGCSPFVAEALIDEQVVFQNGPQPLLGTVTKAETDRITRFPAAILIHGSGPNDRDESSDGALGFRFPHEVRPFRDIAEHLARHGYLVLRYDKRTCVVQNNPHCTATTIVDRDAITLDTFVEDASKGLDYLRSRADVRADDLIVIGHSQGGPIALDLGRARGDVRSVVVLAGPALSLRQSLVQQYEQIVAWLGEEPSSPAIEQQIAETEAERDAYDQTLRAIEEGTYSGDSFDGASIAFWVSWIESHARIEDNVRQLSQPLAVASGTEDYNIPPEHSTQLQQWRGVRAGDLFRLYDGLTHALVTYHPSPPSLEEVVDARLLGDLVQWLDAQPAP